MVVAVVGASGGIGQATARRLAQDGHQVVAFSRRPGPGQWPLDLTEDQGAMRERFKQAADRMGIFDALVQMAGADILSPPLRRRPYLERLGILWQVDVEGTVKVTRAVEPVLAVGGQIITVAWDLAPLGMAGESGELYALAKGAIIAYSKSLAKSWAGRAAVNVLAPGWVNTRWAQSLPSTTRTRLAGRTLAGVWQTPEEVAETVTWMLAMPQSLLTGQVIYVNRGDVMPG